MNADEAEWDGSYAAVESGDRKYFNSAFNYPSLVRSSVDLVVYIRRDHRRIVFCSFINSKHKKSLPVPVAIAQIPPDLICFEITETLAINNLTKAAAIMRLLKSTGCSFALDDFGSGMSSFAYLKNLPVDYLKIDGVFVREIIHDPTAAQIVKAIAKIASVMGIKTIAEFVEHRQILEKLQQLQVDYAQGYGIGCPSPLIFNS